MTWASRMSSSPRAARRFHRSSRPMAARTTFRRASLACLCWAARWRPASHSVSRLTVTPARTVSVNVPISVGRRLAAGRPYRPASCRCHPHDACRTRHGGCVNSVVLNRKCSVHLHVSTFLHRLIPPDQEPTRRSVLCSLTAGRAYRVEQTRERAKRNSGRLWLHELPTPSNVQGSPAPRTAISRGA